MSSLINWQVADGRAREARRIDAALDVHPLARLVALQFASTRSTPAKTVPAARPVTGTAPAAPCR